MKPRPLTARELRSDINLIPALEIDETTDPDEMVRRVQEWERVYGTYSHVFLQCGPGIITTTGKPTSLFVRRAQKVILCEVGPDIVVITAQLWAQARPVEELPYFSECLVPLEIATNRPDDHDYLVRMKKHGVTRLLELKKTLRRHSSWQKDQSR